MKIAVLVSGGVDSSVALRLLQEQGHELTAFYLKIWLEDELAFLGECPWEDDLSYVRAVCEQANVPLEVVPFQKEYWERVVAYTIDEVKNGRTPNPDMLCNARIKFGAFYDFIGDRFEKIATGHYAQVAERNGMFFLKKTPDSIKDQTYFLSQLSQKQLSKALFPIGKYEKKEVRKLAEKFGIMNEKRKDSQGICFLGKIPFNQFLKYHLGEQKGDLVNFETGEKMGEHSGFWYFTVGQRQGIGLSGGPFYVVKKDPKTNTVFIGRDAEKVLQARDHFVIENANWFFEIPADGMKLSVKLRHGPKEYGCVLRKRDENTFEVSLDEKDSGIAEGQFAVFYDGEMCLGGGVIAV